MSGYFYTVEQAAERLKLHPKTVRRFIREQRLPASRVGKSYRILGSDLDAFAGFPDGSPPTAQARTMCVVDVEGVDAATAQRLSLLSAVRASPHAHPEPMSLSTHYSPDRGHMKLILAGSVGDVTAMLNLIQFQLGDRR